MKRFLPPKTVSEAIAPFKAVQNNLKSVLAAQKKARDEAVKRLDLARKLAKQAELVETANIEAAQAEELRAKAVLEKLDAFLSDDRPVNFGDMTPAERLNAGKKLDE